MKFILHRKYDCDVMSPSLRRVWVEIFIVLLHPPEPLPSPSLRRVWVEMSDVGGSERISGVTLLAEGVG